MKSVKIIYKYWGLTDYDFLQDNGIHLIDDQYSIEPCRRDTFPAIALAAAYLKDVQHVGEVSLLHSEDTVSWMMWLQIRWGC